MLKWSHEIISLWFHNVIIIDKIRRNAAIIITRHTKHGSDSLFELGNIWSDAKVNFVDSKSKGCISKHTQQWKCSCYAVLFPAPQAKNSPQFRVLSQFSSSLFTAGLRCGASCGFLMLFLPRDSQQERKCDVLVLIDASCSSFWISGGQGGHGEVYLYVCVCRCKTVYIVLKLWPEWNGKYKHDRCPPWRPFKD